MTLQIIGQHIYADVGRLRVHLHTMPSRSIANPLHPVLVGFIGRDGGSYYGEFGIWFWKWGIILDLSFSRR